MRKLLIGLLTVGLVFAFAMPAAAEVKISGEYNVQGYYYDRSDIQKDEGTTQQWYTQKLRLAFKAEPEEGVSVDARGDVYDNHVWGSNNADDTDVTTSSTSAFDFDYAYGTFTTGIGKFSIGRMAGGSWGLTWGNAWRRSDKIQYETEFGPVGVVAIVEKYEENDKDTANSDDDYDKYNLGATYKWDGGTAGILWSYNDDVSDADTSSYKYQTYALTPYMKATFGPVYVEAELNKLYGSEAVYEDNVATADVDVSGLSYFASAKINVGPGWVSGFYGYVQGDDPNTTENECGFTGDDYDIGYVMFTDEDWGLAITTHGTAINTTDLGTTGNDTDDGGYVYGLRFGVSPIEKLSIKGALFMAKADEKDTYADDDFGTEFDIEASYKLFSSVTYTIRFGYLWTGDYWKGTDATNEIEDMYMVHHMLVWKF